MISCLFGAICCMMQFGLILGNFGSSSPFSESSDCDVDCILVSFLSSVLVMLTAFW